MDEPAAIHDDTAAREWADTGRTDEPVWQFPSEHQLVAAQWLGDKVYNHFATGQLSIQFTYTGPAELVYGEVALAAAGSSVITSSGTVPIGPTVTPRTYTLSVPFATAIAGVYTMFVAMWKDDSKVNSVWNNADDQGRQQAIARVIVNP